MRLFLLLATLLAPSIRAESPSPPRTPNVVIISVDALRTDHLSYGGYDRNASPNIDRLIADGARFTQARSIEPLTAPALCSMFTSVNPHEHGATRNGLRMRSGLASLPKALQAHGYRTVAFIGNWTLKDNLSGLGEHFEQYAEVLNRRRWWGLVRGEATADDLSDQSRHWVEQHLKTNGDQPFLLWVHYVEPHAPYRMHRELVGQLDLETKPHYTAAERYASEVAFVDRSIGELLRGLDKLAALDGTIVAFVADHGESLGEHDYWGHGRHLYEPSLRIPMAIVWPGWIRSQQIDAPALITDLAPTIIGLLDYPSPAGFGAYDWTGVIEGAAPPSDRVTYYQAHKGAVISRHDSDLARQAGLLQVGVIAGSRKETVHVPKQTRLVFGLDVDPFELAAQTTAHEDASERLLGWMQTIDEGLGSFANTPPQPIDEESIEQLRSLGYVD